MKDLYARAERDNDLIYHKEVPSLAALPPITPASLVSSDVPKGLIEPQSVLQRDGVIFGELLAWGAKAAIGRTGVCFRHSSLIFIFKIFITTGRITLCPKTSLPIPSPLMMQLTRKFLSVSFCTDSNSDNRQKITRASSARFSGGLIKADRSPS